MSHIKKFEINATKQAAGQYLNDQEVGDLYDAYMKLKEASGNGNGNELACDYVNVPMSLEYVTVDNILDMIDSAKNIIINSHAENPIIHIDWEELRKQKQTLIEVMTESKETTYHNLEGIVDLIENIQYYAVDILGFDENEVFNLKTEDKLIGYQAMDNETNVHPKMQNTYSVYSKSQIKEMIGDDNQWRIVPIYEGTIENPEYMFEGYPEN